jgi:transposase
MVLADGTGTALGILVEKANPAEVKLLEDTLDAGRVRKRCGRPARRARQPERLIADRAYDSNVARQMLMSRRIEPIIPKRRNNRRATHQDGRKLRRYRRRYIIERTNSWLQNFRRLVVRYERKAKNFEALVHMACALIVLKQVSG